ncbi:LutC/YkgG family protein [Ferrimonas pelagia]
MSSRNAILDALETVDLPQPPMPEIDIAVDDSDLSEQFEASLAKVGGSLYRVGSLTEIQQYLDRRMAEGEQVLSMIETLKGNRALDDTPHALQDVKHALIQARFGVAENGAVFVLDDDCGQRALPYITEHLAVLLRADALHMTMHQAVPATGLPSGHHGVFISGPSKTADIEQALVIGAHGACSMTVFLLE